MTNTNKAVQVGGTWLAIASFLLIVTLGFHGPIAPDLNVGVTEEQQREGNIENN